MSDEHFERIEAMAENDGTWDFSDNDVAALQWAAEEIKRCHARLEIDHCFRMGPEPDLELIRQEVPFEKRATFPDAVRCREATIALLEEDVTTLRSQLAKAKEGLREAEAKLTVWARIPPGHMGIQFVRVRVGALQALRDTARATLAQLEETEG